MINVSDVLLLQVSVQLSIGFGFMGINMRGYINVSNSSFINNNCQLYEYFPCGHNFSYGSTCAPPSKHLDILFLANWIEKYNYKPGGNVMLLYTDESADEIETVTASLSIESSLIAFGLDASFLCLDHNSKSPVLNPP